MLEDFPVPTWSWKATGMMLFVSTFLTMAYRIAFTENTNKCPHHGFTTPELKCIVNFLRNYAEENAVLLPGRIPGFKRFDLQLLPTNTTKRGVWEHYIMSCATLTFRVAAYTTFCAIWRKYMPHIIITTPKTDLCWTCQQNCFAITASSNKPDLEKSRVKKFSL